MTITLINDTSGRRPPSDASGPAGPGDDPWADWKPKWSGAARPPATPQDYQERHAPTEAFCPGGGEGEAGGQRRIVDARLWNALTPAQQDAARLIVHAYEAMNRGAGYVQSRWDGMPSPGGRRAPGGGGASEARAHLVNLYMTWANRCMKEKVSHSMVIDILVFGKTLAQCDRERRVRKGGSKKNLFAGLTLYCKVRGWGV